MKGRLIATAACLVAGLLVPAAASPAGAQVTRCDQLSDDQSRVNAPRRYGFLPDRVVSLGSDVDGAAIQIGVVRPRVPAGRRVPVILTASPYLHALQTVDLRKCASFLVDNFVPQGYAVALLPVRGTGDSGGCFDLFGSRERADIDQAVRWLGTQPWSNGSVGMIGKSYDGGTAWEGAASGNPHLKTIVPISGVPDVFDLLFGSGTPDWRGPGILGGVYFAENLGFIDGRAPERNLETTACPEHAVAELASVYSSLTGDLDPFGYWADRRYTDDILARYRGSVFWVHGLQDWNVNPGSQFPLVSDLRRRGVPVKALLGQWGHSHPDEVEPPSRRPDYADILLRWFDRWLKGVRGPTGPAAQVEDDAGSWRNVSAWPAPGRRATYRLSASGELTAKGAAAGTAVLAPDPVHVQDPAAAQGAGIGSVPALDAVRGVCEQPVCAAFRSKPFTAPYRLSGLPRVQLSATPLGAGGTVSVFLFAEGRNGLRRVGWGQVDLRFPRGRGASQAVQPGEPLTLDFVLQPMESVLPKGERLVMMVSMGNTYNRLPSAPTGPVMLQLGTKAGGLTVTEAAPDSSQFFKPPR